MLINSLFQTGEIPPELENWLTNFKTPIEALNNLPDLFKNLNQPEIHGDVHPSAVVEGAVYVGKGAKIGPCAVLQGPVYVGENTKIGAQALLRKNTYIADNCVVGKGADIKNTLALNGAKIQVNSFTGDSVLGVAARVASGAVLSNRKFNQTEVYYKDENNKAKPSGRYFLGAIIGRHSRIGANCVISPGTIIGENSWIGSGVVLSGTHGNNKFILVEQNIQTHPKDEVMLHHNG